MDKVLSARVEESVVNRIGSLARRLRTSKKKVIENAIAAYAANVEKEQSTDVFQETCGAWHRKESAVELVRTARRASNDSMMRHRR